MKFNKIHQLILGYWILALGISLIIIANLGAGGWDAVFIAVRNKLGYTIGFWAFIIELFLVLLNGIIAKEKPQIKTVFGIFLASIMVDFWMELIFVDIIVEHIYMKVVLFIIGIILLSFGISLYIRTDLLSGPIDGLMIATSKRLNISYKSARILNELIVIIIGYILGGPIGVGTLIIAVGLGYGIQWSMEALNYIKQKTNLIY